MLRLVELVLTHKEVKILRKSIRLTVIFPKLGDLAATTISTVDLHRIADTARIQIGYSYHTDRVALHRQSTIR